MITCLSCNHQNPEGSLQCENCYTPLPATTSCPNCGASVQTDATFCGQCGFNLQAENSTVQMSPEETAIDSLSNTSLKETPFPTEMPLSQDNTDIMPETAMSSSIQSPWDEIEADSQSDEDNFTIAQTSELPTGFPKVETSKTVSKTVFVPNSQTEAAPKPSMDLDNGEPISWEPEISVLEELPDEAIQADTFTGLELDEPDEPEVLAGSGSATELDEVDTEQMGAVNNATQLQIQTASLLHLQSNTTLDIPLGLDIVHLGKSNTQIPPDIDVAGFADSEVVSRIHADIRIEGDAYYIEDVGSSNGTYINHTPLLKGNRHRLRAGDRLALGKGDLVTFVFQLH